MSAEVPDRIEQEIVIEAPPERVWEAITAAEHLGTWFGDAGAEVDLRPGGRIVLRWREHGEFYARIEEVDPPRLLSARWARPARTEPDEGNSTLIEFLLEAEGTSTRLRVVESGFRALAGTSEEITAYVEGNTEGWKADVGELREYVTRLAGAPN
jgi:uncharacterized protein YndB with AHSA1/START domain